MPDEIKAVPEGSKSVAEKSSSEESRSDPAASTSDGPNMLTVPIMIANEIGALLFHGATKEVRIVQAVTSGAPKGDGKKTVEIIDKFCYENWMMNLGDTKGDQMDEAIKAHGLGKLKVAVEFGGYCGYSTVRLANVLAPETKLYTIEANKRFSDAQGEILEHAGMVSDRIEQYLGFSGEFITKMVTEGIKVDFLFMDHHTDCYIKDIARMIKENLLNPGCLIVADNVLFPGAPEYKEWVLENEDVLFKSRVISTTVEYRSDLPDEMLISEFVGQDKTVVFVDKKHMPVEPQPDPTGCSDI